MIKRLLFTLLSITSISANASDTAYIYKPAIPLRIDRDVNMTYDIKIKSSGNDVLESVEVEFASPNIKSEITNASIYYCGTTSMLRSRTQSLNLEFQTATWGGGQNAYSHPSNVKLVSQTKKLTPKTIIKLDQKMVKGDNFFYLSVDLNDKLPLTSSLYFKITQVIVNGNSIPIQNSGYDQPFRPAISVRNHNDDGVDSYRIPGIATATDGALMAVYDIRRNSNYDLQEDVQVGLSRSYDRGQTWQPMTEIIDMRGIEGLPDSQNGVGDPAIAVDNDGNMWCMALWTHGIGGQRAWWGVNQGLDYKDGVAQVVVVKSTDNGKTWGQPQNITSQIKDPSWYILLQGPGRGIVMDNGTLVFPFQYVDSSRMPHATIVYSTDGGDSWIVGSSARSNTTEAQVVELSDGQLMLNMRDNRGGSRAVLTTTDMGKTWIEHSSSRNALIEPVCMASLIKVKAQDNNLGQDLLIFSNPNTTKSRSHITIKVSLDGGMSWLPENQILLDSEPGWGYSCLTMVDKDTVGILYESSVSQLVFQAIPLNDIIKNK